MKTMKKLLLLGAMLAAAGCHTCDVCDDCGDAPAPRRPKVKRSCGWGCNTGCSTGCAGEGLVAHDHAPIQHAPAPVAAPAK